MQRAALNQLLGEHIQTIRHDDGLTQAALGRRCDMSAAEICRYELGQRSPHLLQLKRLAQALNLPMWALVLTPEPLFELVRALRRLPRARRQTLTRRLLREIDAPPVG
ncbi:helix-turn-helix domain-containing protein [Myxococcota bacterium]|jgi:transcriptional regulator with XRE-family HTH domain|nr:helix-turn-helix domain-containing protein [Myxococcota bacterium]